MPRFSPRRGNLPAEATSFIGRHRELAEIRKRLTTTRVVSLVGPGGVGKTRLAIRVATDLGRAFADGIWFVELAELHDPALVSRAVLEALDLRDQAATEPLSVLLAHLQDKELLLVVDNCEHLLAAAAQLVTQVIMAGPGVRVIATSREPLSVPGEHVVPVPPLELPPAHSGQPVALVRQNEAVMLFTERAAAATGAFGLTAVNQAAVVDLCRRLDGLPLAIELAAVRTRVLTVEQILDRLKDRFALLTGVAHSALPRHQTLRTTIDWSHDLLDADEQTLLRRLCVFAGSFTWGAVESICTSGTGPLENMFDSLSSLVDKSLVIKEDIRQLARYHLHETMREFARLKLQEAGEEAIVEQRCTEYYWSRCLQSAGESRSRILEWLEWMEVEIDNVRSVLGRCIANGELDRGVDLTTSLSWYWITRATAEGVHWLDQLVGIDTGVSGTRPWAYFIRGLLAILQADSAAARPALGRAIAAARAIDQPNLLSQSLAMASIAETMVGDRASARTLLDEAQAVAVDLGDVMATLAVLQASALNGLLAGDHKAARADASEGVRLSRESGDLYGLEHMLLNLGFAALIAGDLDESKRHFREGLRIAHGIDDRVAQFYLLGALACEASKSGQVRLSARLLGAAETMRARAGASINGILAPLRDDAEGSAMAALGESKFDAEFKAGLDLSRDRALALALGEPAQVAVVGLDPNAGPLGTREADVARLVAAGMSNKQIGRRLFISDRTVASHVRNIMNKLGFRSRVQIAVWIAASKEN